MKKHFLLLVMALMSMTAWAEDISVADMSVGNVKYGGTAKPGIFVVWKGETLTKGTHYTWDEKYYTDAACTIEAVDGTSTAYTISTLPVGPYYIKIEGKSSGGFSGSKSGSFEVEKKDATFALTTPLTKVFGATDPALGTYTIKDGSTDVSGQFTGTASYSYEGAGVGAHAITISGLTSANYTIVTTEKITITAKTLEPEWITMEKKTAVYTGEAQTPDYTIKDGTTTLVKDQDYTVTVTATNANVYSPKITGKGNYKTTSAITMTDLFEITKAPVTVRANNQEKVYDGTATLVKTGNEGVTYIGFLGAETATSVGATAVLAVTDASEKAAEYVIVPSVAATTNYTFNPVNGTFNIKKAPLTLKADNASKFYGAADPAFTATVTGAINATEKGVMEALIDNTDEASYALTKDNGDIKVTRSNASVNDKGKYEDVLVVSYNTAAPVFANYAITVDNGDFEIKGGNVYVTVLPQEIEYGGKETWSTPELDRDYIVTGLSGTDKLTTAPTLTRANADKKGVGTYAITAAGAAVPDGYGEIVYVPSNLTIKAKALKVEALAQTLKKGQAVSALDQTMVSVDKEKGLANGDKIGDVIVLSPIAASNSGGLFVEGAWDEGIEITLKGGVTNYTLDAGCKKGKLIVLDPDKTIALNRAAKDDYENTAKNNAVAAITAAVATKYTAAEAKTYNLGLEGAWAYNKVKTPATYKKTEDVTIDASKTYYTKSGDIYTAVTTPDASQLDNYYEVVTAEVKYTNDEVDTNNAKLPGAKKEGDTKLKNVTFNDFTLLAEKWYPLVLPFATDVATISEQFGYAIVNILNLDNTDETKIAFKLHMQEIPANTPFVVKVYKETSMNTAQFDDVVVEAPADYEAVTVTDKSGVKFIGTYKGKIDGFRSNEYYFSAAADKNQYYKGNDTNKTYLRPLGAYFQVPATSAARIIEFEEADGTITAIQAVNVKAEARSAEGWYTIGGVKLQGAPTQKGVYIQNGKKVIVK